MIQAYNNKIKQGKIKYPKAKDIIVRQPIKKVEYQEDGTKIEKTVYRETNITKLVNETVKVVKQSAVNTAEQKLREMEKIFSK